MRILIDQAVYSMRNKGNVALLQTAVTRLNKLWSQASIEVLTEAPHLLKLYCPGARPVSALPWQDWSQKPEQIERIHRVLPWPMLRALFEAREQMQQRWPKRALRRLRPRRLGSHPSDMAAGEETPSITGEAQAASAAMGAGLEIYPDLLQAIRGADLVIATGGGYMCDSDRPNIIKVLTTLKLALELGKPTAMVGQGVGPLEDPGLRTMLRTVVPAVDLVLVRERQVALPLLDALGVPSNRVMMTGDDAIEMAYGARTTRVGTGIGVNLRLAHYTQVGGAMVERLRPILHQAARKYRTQLIALPISYSIQTPDHEVIHQLLIGYDKAVIDWRRFETPAELIKRTGRCRLVVTGAFHPAVFALAQGIPVIGLVKSTEYYAKFAGLRDEFGTGCQILRLDDDNLEDSLPATVDALWNSAEKLRPHLWQAAEHQIKLGHLGYRRLYDLVSGHCFPA